VPLDIDKLYLQVQEMASAIPASAARAQLAEAQRRLRRADADKLRKKLEEREQGKPKIPWLVAEPVDTLSAILPAPSPPVDFSVAAADGSTIPPDRHSEVRFYVINVGQTILIYGSAPGAVLDADCNFYHTEEQLFFDAGNKHIPIEGRRLGIRMSVEEMDGLLDAGCKAPSPAIAVCDGSLILWQLQSKDEDQEFCSYYLDRFLHALDAFRNMGVPVVSYISYPGSSEVANSLRLLLCDDTNRRCQDCPQSTSDQLLCRYIGGLRDRHLFQGLLEPGDRSDILISQSQILEKYRDHKIQFFYMDVGGEIARIEAPSWVMGDREMLDLVHGVIYDQCQRSSQYPPYPPVLIEAHEQAVISTGERQMVENIVEQVLAAQGHDYIRSAKDRSKRSRGV